MRIILVNDDFGAKIFVSLPFQFHLKTRYLKKRYYQIIFLLVVFIFAVFIHHACNTYILTHEQTMLTKDTLPEGNIIIGRFMERETES